MSSSAESHPLFGAALLEEVAQLLIVGLHALQKGVRDGLSVRQQRGYVMRSRLLQTRHSQPASHMQSQSQIV